MSILLHLRARWALKAPAHPSAAAPRPVLCHLTLRLSVTVCALCAAAAAQACCIWFRWFLCPPPLPSSVLPPRLFFCLSQRSAAAILSACLRPSPGRRCQITPSEQTERGLCRLHTSFFKELEQEEDQGAVGGGWGGQIKHSAFPSLKYSRFISIQRNDLISIQRYNANE